MLDASELKALASSVSPDVLRAALAEFKDDEVDAMFHDWGLWARPEQLEPPGDWQYWLILAGRGWGKSRTGAEWVKQQIKTCRYVNLIGATADDARDIMIEGDSGILASCTRLERPRYVANRNCLFWPNGAQSLVFTADKPDRLRGKQHWALWADELASWRYEEAWDQAMFGLRLGKNPRAIVTTTPKPRPLVKELAKDPMTFLTRGRTSDNAANLAPSFLRKIISKYEGTRLGRQELNAEILDDNPNALWNRAQLDLLRVPHYNYEFKRIVVGVDPATTSNDSSDETGIIVVGLGWDDHAYVLEDATLIGTPDEWAKAVVAAFHRFKADKVVAETNNGGDLVEAMLRTVDKYLPYKKVHASRGKTKRAEPISALYEQGRVHHVGFFAQLEDQMCEYDPSQEELRRGARRSDGGEKRGLSPDRMDALVWAITELFSIDEFGFTSASTN